MATYSLTIRQNKGSKLTIQEVDNNWLYLEDLVSQGGGGSVDSGQIAFGGTASGLTFSNISSDFIKILPIVSAVVFRLHLKNNLVF